MWGVIMSSEHIIFDENEFEVDSKEESNVIRNLLTDSFSIYYFMSVPQLVKFVNILLKPKFLGVVSDFYHNPKTVKILRENIKNKMKINNSTVSHHISSLYESGLLIKRGKGIIKFSTYSIILLDTIIKMRDELLITYSKAVATKHIVRMLTQINKAYKIFIIEALSSGAQSFSDLRDKVNLMIEIAKNQLKSLPANKLAYYLQGLNKSQTVRKEEKSYLLTDFGLNIYKFANLVLLNFTKLELEKDDIKKKSIKEFGYETKDKLVKLYIKKFKEKDFFDSCSVGFFIFISENGKYRGFFERNSCDRLVDHFTTRYFFTTTKNFREEISESILKIRPLDENKGILYAITYMNLYNISALPVLRKNKIVGFLDKIKISRAVYS